VTNVLFFMVLISEMLRNPLKLDSMPSIFASAANRLQARTSFRINLLIRLLSDVIELPRFFRCCIISLSLLLSIAVGVDVAINSCALMAL
jgi:hypothetical protein